MWVVGRSTDNKRTFVGSRAPAATMASSFMVARTSLSAAEAQALEQSMKTGGVMEGYVRRKPHNPHKVRLCCLCRFDFSHFDHLPLHRTWPWLFVIIHFDPAALFLFDVVVVYSMPIVDAPVIRRDHMRRLRVQPHIHEWQLKRITSVDRGATPPHFDGSTSSSHTCRAYHSPAPTASVGTIHPYLTQRNYPSGIPARTLVQHFFQKLFISLCEEHHPHCCPTHELCFSLQV